MVWESVTHEEGRKVSVQALSSRPVKAFQRCEHDATPCVIENVSDVAWNSGTCCRVVASGARGTC
ncbi:hypothetical protein ES319_A07G116200v1 [Gossypium barbadense]|uniref:Uncharacterized protein n=2 Tax=Gossypium TaxID=3633 RepID=A0A5J5V2N3_GOSBA|nr:hypothetical protein ES319_A07G116200v1 [Gossypium barbadense]TYH09780.1 hypothetical protein ES288_A07G124200v1 [Gossypium darwinii]